MITLNDRIVFTLPQQNPVSSAGVYKYELLELDDYSSEYKTIFAGNFYYSGTGAKDFDCTDIIRNRKDVVTLYTKSFYTASNGISYIPQKLVKRYRIAVYMPDPNISVYTSILPVAMVYPYINLGQLTNPENIYFDGYNASVYFTIANQGFRDSLRRMELVPHYPIINTDKYNYMQSLYIGKDLQASWMRKQSVYGGIYGDYEQLSQQQYDDTTINIKQPLGAFIKGNYGSYAAALSDIRNVDVEIYQRIDEYSETNQVKVANLDICPSRYYLQWQDRLGGFQSQPLKDNVTYSETFSNEQVQSYTNAKRNSTVGVNPKWKLHTGWIEEKLYPLYESIFVTSYLVLYDSLYDKSYNVICTGDWTEKTFKNQKKLLDITFNFEADTKQNIIY